MVPSCPRGYACSDRDSTAAEGAFAVFVVFAPTTSSWTLWGLVLVFYWTAQVYVYVLLTRVCVAEFGLRCGSGAVRSSCRLRSHGMRDRSHHFDFGVEQACNAALEVTAPPPIVWAPIIQFEYEVGVARTRPQAEHMFSGAPPYPSSSTTTSTLRHPVHVPGLSGGFRWEIAHMVFSSCMSALVLFKRYVQDGELHGPPGDTRRRCG